MAWGLAKLYRRAVALGMVWNGACVLPYKQRDLADALGLSVVHTNKTLSRLRTMGLVIWRDDRLKIIGAAAVAQLAGIDISDTDRRPDLSLWNLGYLPAVDGL